MANEEQQHSSPSSSNANEQQYPNPSFSDSSDSDSNSDSDSEYSSYDDEPQDNDIRQAFRFRRSDEPLPESQNTPEINFRDFAEVLDSKRLQKIHEEVDPDFVVERNPFDFPEDPENWTEEDLRELWADGPLEIGGTGWDPAFVEEDEWEYVQDEIADGGKPPIAPFYLPYRKHYPAIPDNHYDISNPKAVIEELDRIEEFLKWVSYIFADGSSYVLMLILIFTFCFHFRYVVVLDLLF